MKFPVVPVHIMKTTIMKTVRPQTILLAALIGGLAISTASAQNDSGFYRPFTLEPADSVASGGGAGEDEERAKAAELAKKLSNPVAALISVPIQNNFDWGAGPKGDGFQYKVNIQPVIPISLNENWNLISRTVLPVVYQENVIGTSSQSGLADTVQSFFLSPKEPTKGGWIWGVGPAFLLPTATDSLLGGEKWGAGPTAVLLKQQNGWTYGALANHLWSFAGESSRQDVSATFLQPFVAYTTKQQTTFTFNTESTYDWESSQWTVPLNLMAAQLVKVGKLPLQFQVGGRYYAEKADHGPEWGLRFSIVFLFPK